MFLIAEGLNQHHPDLNGQDVAANNSSPFERSPRVPSYPHQWLIDSTLQEFQARKNILQQLLKANGQIQYVNTLGNSNDRSQSDLQGENIQQRTSETVKLSDEAQRVANGDRVTILLEDQGPVSLLLGEAEIVPSEDDDSVAVSEKSPLGRAILGQPLGSVVRYRYPRGTEVQENSFTIVGISSPEWITAMTYTQVYLVSHNPGKVAAAQRAFEGSEVELIPIPNDREYPEIQAQSSLDVARYTAVQAAKELQHPVIREDHSLWLHALQMPGPFTSFLEKKIPPEQIIRLTQEFNDNTGHFEVGTVLAFPSGKTFEYTFQVPMTVGSEVKGNSTKGWNGVIRLYDEQRALTEYPESERLHIWNQGFAHMAEVLENLDWDDPELFFDQHPA